MNDNYYESLNDFIDQYSTGVRDPANNRWYGLEFCYNQKYYRLDVSGGNICLLRIIIDKGKEYPDISSYEIIENYNSMKLLLESTIIEGLPFSQIITNKKTQLLGQD